MVDADNDQTQATVASAGQPKIMAPDTTAGRGALVMAVLYLVLVCFIIVFCAVQSSNFDTYSKYWGLFGTLIGVATGAIPSYFFKKQADSATAQVRGEAAKAQALALSAPPEKRDEIMETYKAFLAM